jgi:hypothetical protein
MERREVPIIGHTNSLFRTILESKHLVMVRSYQEEGTLLPPLQ